MNLREARERAGYTQDELSDVSGVPQAVISRLETGVTADPNFSTVLRLAKPLGVKPEQLTFGQGVSR